MSKYLIHLKPLGNFYFGGERSFQEYNPAPVATPPALPKPVTLSYIVESNYYPQQTALLGMLRFLLLRNANENVFKNNKIVDTTKASELIGPSSFSLQDEECEFGKILKIGTCFIGNGTDVLLPMPLDYELEVKFTNASIAKFGVRDIVLPQIMHNDDEYTAKDGISEKLILGGNIINYDCDKNNENGVFIKDRRIGINRDIESGKVAKNSLYKQVFYRMVDGYEFVFEAEFRDEPCGGFNSKKYDNQIVTLGGDNSKFLITFKDEIPSPQYNSSVKAVQGKFKAVLLSDALISDNTSCFSISANTPMRFMVTDVEKTTNYSKIKKSERRSLYKKGSVFYFDSTDDRTAFVGMVEGDKNFKNIGYNNIQIID